MSFVKKLFKLPGPVELGMSDCDALEDETFSDNPIGPTWQDWHKIVKKMHPAKYFFAETLRCFLLYRVWFPLWRPVSDAKYWLVSHLVPKRRYHMLDLRQKDGYRYGWVDVPEKMLYAMFNLLKEYLDEGPYDLTKKYSLEEIYADEGMKIQHKHLQEALAINYWWTVQRSLDDAEHKRMQDLWWEHKKNKWPNMDLYWKQMNKLEADIELKTEEMILRLMKIRRGLWI